MPAGGGAGGRAARQKAKEQARSIAYGKEYARKAMEEFRAQDDVVVRGSIRRGGTMRIIYGKPDPKGELPF